MNNTRFLNKYSRLWSCIGIAFLLVFISFTVKAENDLTQPQKSGGKESRATAAGNSTKANASKTHKNDKVLATVNGEPIFESQIDAGIPADVFEFAGKEAKGAKLRCSIDSLILSQFLKKENIVVTSQEIDAEVERMKKEPPQSTCMCCVYNTLEDYLSVNYLSMADLRQQIGNSFGINKYFDRLWQAKHPDDAERKEMINKERGRFEGNYLKTWHILFNTFQQPDYLINSGAVRKTTWLKAESVWLRLQKGEAFEKVAAEVSDDTTSKKKGGYLGCLRSDTFGDALKDAKKQAKYGEYSRPIESPYGFHIIKLMPMNDEDIYDLLKKEYISLEGDKFIKDIQTKAVVVKM